MFEGFTLERVSVGNVELRVRHGGSGPPVLLLHGHPRTHATWNKVAPLLAGQFTVVCPDLRGYGESSKPPTGPDHSGYSKRAMAADCVALMRALGHPQFCAAGHDRGTYVAQRLAMDYPGAVRRLCLMDGIPIGEALARCDATFAASWYHWFFFAQTQRPAERFINADPEAWYTATPEHMGQEAYEDYRRAIHDPETVHAMMEDYRAGSASTASTTTPTARPGAGSAARCCSCGRAGTTWRISTAIRWRSGVTGPTTSAARPSTAATTSPRRHRPSWPATWRASSPAPDRGVPRRP
jgi:haloacetate dehalogenase